MKIKEIFENIIKNNRTKDWINLDDVASDLGLSDIWDIYVSEEDEKIKSYFFGNWICTDSYVGWKAYFFNDEPMAISYQSDRKSDEQFRYVSEDMANKVKDYLLTLRKDNGINFELLDMEEDLGAGYSICYNSQVLDWSNMYHNGVKVELVETCKSESGYDISQKIRIRYENLEEYEVDIRDIKFGYFVNIN